MRARRRAHAAGDEPTDTPHVTAQLAGLRADLEAAGLELELGADVTLYYCAPCDFAEARFAYPEPPA